MVLAPSAAIIYRPVKKKNRRSVNRSGNGLQNCPWHRLARSRAISDRSDLLGRGAHLAQNVCSEFLIRQGDERVKVEEIDLSKQPTLVRVLPLPSFGTVSLRRGLLIFRLCAIQPLLDFTESFNTPFFHSNPLPGKPIYFAAPELLLSLRSEISTIIAIWAFANRELLYLAHNLRVSVVACVFSDRLSSEDRLAIHPTWLSN